MNVFDKSTALVGGCKFPMHLLEIATLFSTSFTVQTEAVVSMLAKQVFVSSWAVL